MNSSHTVDEKYETCPLICSLSFEYAQQGKYRILPTTPKFQGSFRFVENQPSHYFREGQPSG